MQHATNPWSNNILVAPPDKTLLARVIATGVLHPIYEIVRWNISEQAWASWDTTYINEEITHWTLIFPPEERT
jgi:hypothetical protein